jgi:hypothetical protein
MEPTDKPRPLFQRPESSRVDLMDFSFTKPASHKKPFSLRNIPNQSSVPHYHIDNVPGLNRSMEGEEVATRPMIRLDTYV